MALVPTIAPPAVVAGAVRVPLPFGLFSVLIPREGSTDRWENGVGWETLTCDDLGGIGAPICLVDAVQTVTVGGAGLTSFTLTLSGDTTGAILANASAADVQAALAALGSVGAGNVSVAGAAGGPWAVTFEGTLSGLPVATMTATPTGGTGTVTVAVVSTGESTLGLPKSLEPNGGDFGDASPLYVYGHYNCSPIGTSFEMAAERARQHLLVREEARVEQALWTGDLGNVPNFAAANGYPALEDAGTFAEADAWLAVSALEQAIATGYGSLGVLHMSREVATWLTDRGQLRASGSRLVTPLGTPVVAGTGYGSDKIVATGALFGYRGEVFTSSDTPGDLLDRRNNNLYAIAERAYVLGFDPCGAAVATLTAAP